MIFSNFINEYKNTHKMMKLNLKIKLNILQFSGEKQTFYKISINHYH